MEFLNSYADLQSYAGTSTVLDVAGNLGPGNGTHGRWVLDTTIGTSVSPNIGTHQRDANGNMWRRDFYGPINPMWFQAATTDDAADIIQRALNASVSALLGNYGAMSIPVRPQGNTVWSTSKQIVVPQFAQLDTGGNRRTAIFNYGGTDAAFLVENVNYTRLRGFRIGLSQYGAGGIRTHAKNGLTCRWGDQMDIEVAGTNGLNQYGIWMYVEDTSIITENIALGLSTFCIDRPEIRSGTEGNFNYFYSYTNPGMAYAQNTTTRLSGQVGINRTSHAEFSVGRINGAPSSGFTGMQENGARSTHLLVVDCGSSARAINVQGVGNTLMVQRPELLTPIGYVAQNNQFVGEQGGWVPVASQFVLAGWGANAQVSELTGDNQSLRLVIQTKTGDTMSQYPTVTFNFRDGVWSGSRVAMVTRDGGNDPTTGVFATNGFDGGWAFTYAGTPIAGGVYAFKVSRVS